MLQHEHYVRYVVAQGSGSYAEGAGGSVRKPASNYLGIADGRFNTNENRVVNFTYILWKRIN